MTVQAAKKQVADQLVKRISKELDDNAPLDQLIGLLNAASNYLQATQTIEVLETEEVSDVLRISKNHAHNWSKHPEAPVVRIGALVRWPLHMIFQWLSVPQNFADLTKYKSA